MIFVQLKDQTSKSLHTISTWSFDNQSFLFLGSKYSASQLVLLAQNEN